MSNIGRARQVVETLGAAGVATVCCCPGGRNAPLVAVLARTRGLERLDFYDERGAAFFALGRARATGRPAAVVTTSGTAAAELLPAAIEARHTGTPLVLLTADRPPALRGTGAPQAIIQPGLYGPYAPTVFDGVTAGDRLHLATWAADGPVHVNVCFDEPLLDAEPPPLVLSPAARAVAHGTGDATPVRDLVAAARHPLVIVGPLAPEDHDGVRRFLLALGAPVFAEATSGLREDAALAPVLLAGGNASTRHPAVDAVLRIGGVPTLRFWRDLDGSDLPVASVSAVPLPGLARGVLVVGSPGAVLADLVPPERPSPALIAADRRRAAGLVQAIEREPASELALVRALSRTIPDDALVYLGNSLPIREWDLAADRAPRARRVAASRGANGIDGQLHTFLGMCGPGREHWAIVGDLTALYDLGAPWILPRLGAVGPIRIVIINNAGGQIFQRLFDDPAFLNPHDRAFDHWAALWGLRYLRWDLTSAPVPPAAGSGPLVLEAVPEAAASRRVWEALAS